MQAIDLFAPYIQNIALLSALLGTLLSAFVYAMRQRANEKIKREIERVASEVRSLVSLAHACNGLASARLELEYEKPKREYLEEDEKPKNHWSLDGEIVYIAKAQ